jgi:hypothetical protein
MRYIRCSSLPAAFSCPGSIQTPALRINPDSEPANEGNAGHAVMHIIAERDLTSLDEVNLTEIARAYKVDADELRHAAWNGIAVWRQIRESFPGARGEVDFASVLVPDLLGMSAEGRSCATCFHPPEAHIYNEGACRPGFTCAAACERFVPAASARTTTIVEDGVTLTGHADLLARDGARANGADWKFGRVDKDYSHQVRGYMALTLLMYPEIEHVAWTIVWMRERETESYTMDRAQGLPDFLDRFTRDVVGWDGTYRPGPKSCAWCPRAHECPALEAMARRDVALLTDGDLAAKMERGLVELPDETVVDLYRRAKYITNACDSLKEAIRARVEHAGGALDGGDGTELRFISTNSRVIDPLAAWPVMEARLGPEDIAAVVKVPASRLDDVIATKAGRGNGASAKRELAAALEAAGAIRLVPGKRLSDQRKK